MTILLHPFCYPPQLVSVSPLSPQACAASSPSPTPVDLCHSDSIVPLALYSPIILPTRWTPCLSSFFSLPSQLGLLSSRCFHELQRSVLSKVALEGSQLDRFQLLQAWMGSKADRHSEGSSWYSRCVLSAFRCNVAGC